MTKTQIYRIGYLIVVAIIIVVFSCSCESRYRGQVKAELQQTDLRPGERDEVQQSDRVLITTFTNLYAIELHGCKFVVLKGSDVEGDLMHHPACNNINHSK